jgi:hypothetical protein
MPRKKVSIVAGIFRLVKITEAPRNTIHLHFVPPDVAIDPLALMRFSQPVPLGIIIPVASELAKKFPTAKTYTLSLREES